jgi:hypothetical protein
VAASTPGGAPLGDFGLTIGPNYFYFLSNVGDGELAALIDTSLYCEENPFTGGTASSPEPSTLFLMVGGAVCFAGRRPELNVYTTVDAARLEVSLAVVQRRPVAPSETSTRLSTRHAWRRAP